jgi:hypothetical protein
MDWIDERLAAKRKIEGRSQAINDNAERIFDVLWEEISVWVKVAERKPIAIFTNGSPRARVVGVSLFPGPEPRSMTIGLCKENQSICVGGITPPVEFKFDLGPDNVVFLKHNGQKISIQDAAHLLLDMFLFPEFRET